MKKYLVILTLSLLALILAACGGQFADTTEVVQPPSAVAQEQPTAPAEEPGPPATLDTFDTQTSDAGQVVIDVTPRTFGQDAWDFEVALNTHSVSLNFDLTTVSVLRCDQGQEYAPVAWEGSGPGGHHRSGVLKFAAVDHPVSLVEIVIRDVAEVPERIFRWDVPGGAELSQDRSITQPPEPQPTSEVGDGPARVVLSGEEFHFGDVVLSQGMVSREIDITNTGTGTLHIEGVVPT